MKTFLNSLRSDLLDRRFLPVLTLLGLALLAALAFAVLGGSSTSPTPPPTNASGSTGPAGAIAITQAPATNEAVAETTEGAHQRAGTPRNPFTPLPSKQAKASSASTPPPSSTGSANTGANSGSANTGASSGSSSSGSSSSGSPPSPGPSSPSKPSQPSKPKTPQKIYHVDVLFGAAPAGTPPASIPLKPFNDLTRLSPLTVGGEAPLVFAGATAGGASAIFTVVSEVFLRGPAICHPSASQCQAIALAPGQSEELEYSPTTGQGTIYKLQVVSIQAVKASAAKAARAYRATSPAGRALLRGAGLSALPGLRYSTDSGVIVLVKHHPFAAHAARHRR